MEIKSHIQADGDMSIMGQIISSVMAAAPLVVASSLLVIGLNSDRVDGYEAVDLLNRANHTGFQAISSVSGLQTSLDSKANTTALSNYVQIGTANNITADHNFTGFALKMSQHYFHNTYDGSNVYAHYYPSNAGNGATSSFANFRVWNGPESTLKTLRFGGDGTFIWDGKNVATETWVTAQDRFVSSFTAVSNLDNVINGGVKCWTDSTANKPEGYGSVMTFAGVSGTGTVVEGGWISQIMSGTSGNWYVRMGGGIAGPAANWGSTYQLWTAKQFTQADITKWNAADTKYVSIATANEITAHHRFTGDGLEFPRQHFHGNYGGTDTFANYYPYLGAVANTFANLRVWNYTAGTQKVLRFGGDGTFTWDGNNVITAPLLATALIAKENSFSKGDLIQGTGITFSGSGVGRLYGAGNLTINASGSGSWNDALTVSATAQVMPIISRGPATSPTDYLQLKPTDWGPGKPYLAISKSFTANKWEYYSYDGVATNGALNFALNLTRFDVPLLDENRQVATGPGLIGGGYLSTDRTLYVDFGTGFNQAARGDDTRINNGQTAFGWGNPAGLYVSIGTTNNITASHIFSGEITLPGSAFKSTYDGSNTYQHYYGSGGNGGTSTVANLRVWNGPGGSFKTLRFGGDGIMTWDGNTVATQSWVTSNTVPTSRTLTINGTSYDLSANRSWTISGGGGGTVTSVGLTVPLGFTVTSSPVTSSGNISFAYLAGYELLGSTEKNKWNNYEYQINNKLDYDKTITINGNSQYLNNNPNFTISGGGGGISGGGTSGYIPLWNSGSNIVNSYLRAQTNGTTGDSIYGRFSMDIQADKTAYPGFIVSDTSYSASGEATALVQLDSQTRGFLGPRMTYTQRTSISSPAAGLQVFQTNSGGAGVGFYGYNGSSWVLLG